MGTSTFRTYASSTRGQMEAAIVQSTLAVEAILGKPGARETPANCSGVLERWRSAIDIGPVSPFELTGKSNARTGIAIELPANTEAQIRPRSGPALEHLVTVLNAPGTFDEGYRAEIGVILINHGRTAFRVLSGSRIAQLVV